MLTVCSFPPCVTFHCINMLYFMHPVVEGRWPVSSLRCETVVTCVCVGTHNTLLSTHYCFFKQPTRNAESIVGQVCIVGLLIKNQDYSYCLLMYASCEGKVFPMLCRCGGAGSWHSSFLSTLSCRMNSVFPMSSCSLAVFNVSCSPGCTMGSYCGFQSSFH